MLQSLVLAVFLWSSWQDFVEEFRNLFDLLQTNLVLHWVVKPSNVVAKSDQIFAGRRRSHDWNHLVMGAVSHHDWDSKVRISHVFFRGGEIM
jgi:hypothetical protein